MDSLFTDNFPIVTTTQELETIFVDFPQYDRYYITSGCLIDRKERFEALRPIHKSYADSNFLNEIKTNFHARTREMYMTNICAGNWLFLKSSNEWPDLIVEDKIYLECVVSSQWDESNPHRVPDLIDGIQDVPEHEMLLRMTSSISEKFLKYQNKRQSKSWFSKQSPFIIALNTWDLKFSQNPWLPLILKALFWIGYLTIPIDKTKEPFRWLRTTIRKWDKNIPTMMFEDTKYTDISAIIRSQTDVLNHPNQIWEDCIIVHNPHAINPLDINSFNFLDQWIAEWDQIKKIPKNTI